MVIVKASARTMFYGLKKNFKSPTTIPGAGGWGLVHEHSKGAVVLGRAICLELCPVRRRRCAGNSYRNCCGVLKTVSASEAGELVSDSDSVPYVWHIFSSQTLVFLSVKWN